ncbi:hypothetical protein TURU_067469 [Turdus rufiventris]|nr:hypothetical protein TURU_067469 [Turdus rufiventris]
MASRKEGSGSTGGGFGAAKGKGKAAAAGDSAVKQVQIDGLVVLKIIKHYQEEGQGNEVVQGVLLGLVVDDRLEITNCFPFPQHTEDDADFDEELSTRMMMLMNLFFEELRDTYKSTALVLMEGFNLPEINWEHHTAGTTHARRFLKNLEDSFMKEVLRELTGKDSCLGLLLVDRVDLMNKVEIGGCLGHIDHKVMKFKISVDRKKGPAKPQLWT